MVFVLNRMTLSSHRYREAILTNSQPPRFTPSFRRHTARTTNSPILKNSVFLKTIFCTLIIIRSLFHLCTRSKHFENCKRCSRHIQEFVTIPLLMAFRLGFAIKWLVKNLSKSLILFKQLIPIHAWGVHQMHSRGV